MGKSNPTTAPLGQYVDKSQREAPVALRFWNYPNKKCARCIQKSKPSKYRRKLKQCLKADCMHYYYALTSKID